MIQLYLIRHGQTDWNVQRRLQGHSDIPLNEKGRAQSKALKKILQNLGLEAIFASDLSRAVETAQIARPHDSIPIIASVGLRESALGEAEGLFFDELRLKFPNAYEQWLSTQKHDEDFSFPGGESKLQSRERILKVLPELLTENPYKIVGIVTHGGLMRRLFEASQNFGMQNVRTYNTSVFQLSFDSDSNEFRYIGGVYQPEG